MEFTSAKGIHEGGPDLLLGSLVTGEGNEYYFGFDVRAVRLLWLERFGSEYQAGQPIWHAGETFLKVYLKNAGALDSPAATIDYEIVKAASTGQSLKVLPTYEDGKARNGRVAGYFGISKATGPVAYYSGDNRRSRAYLETVGHHRGPDQLNDDFRNLRRHDSRAIVAIVEGPYEFMVGYKDRLHEADYVVFVGDTESLGRLDVKVADARWKKPRSLDEVIFGKSQRVGVPYGEYVADGKPVAEIRMSESAEEVLGEQEKSSFDSRRMRPAGPPKSVQRHVPDDSIMALTGPVVGMTDRGSISADDDDIALRAAAFLGGQTDMPADLGPKLVKDDEEWDHPIMEEE